MHLQVMATIDDTPAFSPPQPAMQGIIVSQVSANEFSKAVSGVPSDGAYTIEAAGAAAALAESNTVAEATLLVPGALVRVSDEQLEAQHREVKASMQSHFD